MSALAPTAEQDARRTEPEIRPEASRASSWLRWPREVRTFGLLAGVGVLTLVGGFPALTAGLVLLLAARHMPAETWIRRVLLAVVALFGATAAVLTVASWLDVRVDPRGLAVAYLLAGALLPAGRRPVPPALMLRLGGRSDWYALGTAAAGFLIYYRPFIHASPGRVMAQLSFGTDPANHLSFVQQAVQAGGYIPGSDYPPAWSGNVAVLSELLAGQGADPTSVLGIAPALIVGCYALLLFFGVAVALDVVGGGGDRTRQLPSTVTVAVVGLVLVAGPGSLLLRSGSYTQTIAMVALLAMVSLFTSVPADLRATTVLGLFALTLMQTWYLLAPVLAVVSLLYVVTRQPAWSHVLSVALPTAVLSSYPVLNGPGAITQVNMPGGVQMPTPAIVCLMLVLSLCAVVRLVRHHRTNGPQSLVLVALVVATLVQTSLLVAAQGAAGAPLGYYGSKLLYVVFVFGGLVCACVVGVECRRLSEGQAARRGINNWLSAALVLVVGLGWIVTSIGTRSLTWSYATGQPPSTPGAAVLDAMFQAHPRGLPTGTDAWVVDGCAEIADHIASKWTHDVFQTWTDARRETNNLTRSGLPDDLLVFRARAQSAEVQRIEVFVHELCQPDAVDSLAASQKVIVIRVP